MAATQKQVAELAKVSQATVSLVLSPQGRSTLSRDTINAVETAARELGYRVNRSAQALKSGRTQTIGCVVPDLTNPFYPELVRGVRKVAEESNHDIIIYDSEGAPEREHRFIEWAQAGRVDGVVGAFFNLRVPDLAPLLNAGIAISRIEISQKSGGALPVDSVFVDNKAASAAAAKYLIEKGFSPLAIVSGPGEPSSTRVTGFLGEAEKSGCNVTTIEAASLNEEGGFAATQKLIAGANRPRAIFAVNDYMAIGALHALHTVGLSVPDDVAVMGFDDIPVAALAYPSLTTVSQPQAELGRRAAVCLMSRINKERSGRGVAKEVEFAIVERAST
ncbi:MAG: LacI family DNA-binding transcriptional regulator [Pseudomonadota bacterium]